MAVLDGNVQVDVKFTGSGNVTAKANEAGKAVQNVDKAAKGLDKSMAGAVKRFGELGPVSVEGADRARGEFDKLVGVLGVVGGLAVGIYEGFKALSAMSLASTIAEMRELAVQAGKVATGYVNAAKASATLINTQRSAQLDALQTRLSIAQSRGDNKEVKELTASIKALKGSFEAGDRRQQAREIREQAAQARVNQAQGAGGLAASLGKLGLYAQRLEELSKINALQLPMGQGLAVIRERERLQALIAAESASLPTLNLAAQGTAIMEGGEAVAAALEEVADLIDIDKLLPPGGGGGGGGGKPRGVPPIDLGDSPQFGSDIDWDNLNDQLALMNELDDTVGGAAQWGSDIDWDVLVADLDALAIREQAEAWTAWADGIGYVSDQISQFYPELGAFGEAADQVKTIWANYADEQFNVGAAVGASVGALAKAGAQQIKNERARAGVLALIELGMGLGKQFVPGLQAEAAGHFAAAGVLGLVAAAGGGGGGGGAGGKRTQPKPRQLTSSESRGSGNWTVNINAPYLASSQETARAIRDIVGGV